MRKFKSIIIRNERQFRAFTGLPESAFDRLLIEFTRCLEAAQILHHKNHGSPRKRRLGGGRKGALPTPELKLFFILFYLKNYPIFDVLGGLFDLSPSKAEENVVKLIPILKKAEQCLKILPHRHFKPTHGDEQPHENIQKIIIDATERPCCRPKNSRRQKRYYSGKKHAHTLKNTVFANVNGGIDVIGPTVPGSRHDYALLKEELSPTLPGLSTVEVSVDLGYLGIKDRYPTFNKIHIPYKKSKKSKENPFPSLNKIQKKENRAISRIRVTVEHLIGDLKSFQILTTKFRNRLKGIEDKVILVVAGLCNFKNSYAVQ